MNATPEQQQELLAVGISLALVGLVEFVEENGSALVVCDSACRSARRHAEHWFDDRREVYVAHVRGRQKGFCQCGTLVGFLSDGAPYRIRFARIVEEFGKVRDLLHDMETTDATIAIQEREEARDQTRGLLAALEQAQAERDHLRRALEWLANRKAGAIGAGGGQDFEIDCGQRKGRAKNAEDWAAAALAATEEALDE